MTPSKSLVFIAVFVIALFIAGSLLLNKQKELTTNHSGVLDGATTSATNTSDTPSATSTTEVLGSTQSSIDTTYNRQNALKRLTLTPENIIWYTNYERVKKGLPIIQTSNPLSGSARLKNSDMFKYQYFSHHRITDPNTPQVGFDTFIDAENYQFLKIGENLAKGDFSTSAEVVTAWMNSASHRKNILDPQYRDIGVAINSGEMNGRHVVLITQHFGSSKESCPTVNTATKQAIDTLRERITGLQKDITTEQQNISQISALVDPRFDSIIDEYNKIVDIYNKSIKTMGELVNDYNSQIKEYDRCITGRL